MEDIFFISLSVKLQNLCFIIITIIFFSFTCTFHDIIQVSSQDINGDSHLLLSFKDSLPNPGVLPNWKSNQNPCSFTGVSCNNNNNNNNNDVRVSSLDLISIPLNSDFSSVSYLMSLDHLEKLSLKFTNLTGKLSSLPSKFHCSDVLTDLDLAGNDLSGSVSDIMSLSSCKSLKNLNLSKNSFDFRIKNEGSDSLLIDFQYLDLSFNLVSGQNIVQWILSTGCSDLKYLNLAGNQVSGNIQVPSSCSKLEHIDLSSNKFSGGIPAMGNCDSLEYLDLSGNRLSDYMGDELSRCGSLKFLNLSDNKVSGEIPRQLGDSCSNLIELDFSSNYFYGSIPDTLSSCSLLETINLSNNSLSGEFPTETLVEMSNLKNLILSYNQFVGVLPYSLSKLTNLELLELSSNNFSGSIPSNLCQDPKNSLKELYLQNNLFTDTIPASLSNCSNLVSLDFSFNYLSGTIPSSLGSLSRLRDMIMWLNQLSGEIPRELMYIQTLENLILDNNELSGTIPSGLRNCTNLNWISLSSNRLSGEIPTWIGELNSLAILKLGNNSISGSIPKEIGDCKSLIWLDLHSNNLSGSIPSTLSKQAGKIAVGLFVTGKKYVYLKNDGSINCHGAGNLLEFEGIRPEGLNRIPTRNSCNFTRIYMGSTQYTFINNGSMIFLDLSYNKLDGSIPKEIGDMFYLTILNLGHNMLSGSIPTNLGSLKNVGILDLSYNKLEGQIPSSFSGLSLLTEMDLSYNNLSGPIPLSGQLATFQSSNYKNNTGLCGYPLPPCGDESLDPNASRIRNKSSSPRKAYLLESVAMGLLFSIFCIIGLVVFVIERNKRRRKKDMNTESDFDFDNNISNLGFTNTNWKLTSATEAMSINLSTFDKPLQKLTFADLLQATNGFHDDSLIGSGGFGDVYKAQLKDGMVVAVKKLIQISGQGDREFMAEMETIGRIKHRNLVPLLGYCKVGEERLLVYEFMKFGSLEDVLQDRKKSGIKLNWKLRRKIAIGAARGLAFLHHTCTPHIIHRDMKSSNVLLDENLEARVSDFGMARLMISMDTHLTVSTLAGTPGYVPPEYYQSFRCSTKGDVYSYGVVLLELLTGKKPTGSIEFGENNLVGWVKQHEKAKITDVLDHELMIEDPSLEFELRQHLLVALACLDDRPWLRPTMIQVMAKFKEIQTKLDETTESFGAGELVDMAPIKECPEVNQH